MKINTYLLILLCIILLTGCSATDPDVPDDHSSRVEEELPTVLIGLMDIFSDDEFIINFKIENTPDTKMRRMCICYAEEDLLGEDILPDTLNSIVQEIPLENITPTSVILSGLKPDIYYVARFFSSNRDESAYSPLLRFSLYVEKEEPEWEYLSRFPDIYPYGNIFCTIKDKIYIGLGGIYKNQTIFPTKEIWVYSATDNVWSKKGDFPGRTRRDAATMVIDDIFYVIGGQCYLENSEHTEMVRDIWAYSPENDIWTQKNDFPHRNVGGAATFVLEGKGYLLGGWVGGFLNEKLWEYDPVMDIWKEKASFPGGFRSSPSLCTYNGKAYLMGGCAIGSYSSPDCWVYDPVSDVWEQKNDLPDEGRSGAFPFVHYNKIYLFGGNYYDGVNNSYTGITNDLWVYDPEKDEWEMKENYLRDTPGLGYNTLLLNQMVYVMANPNVLKRVDSNLF